jgi:hypothetical protein
MTATINGIVIKITRQFNPKTSNIDFFTEFAGHPDELLVEALAGQCVNLSRGHNRQYNLTDLSRHNGTGACWTDGQGIHTADAQAKYTARCEADITAALAAAGKGYTKAVEAKRFDTTPVCVASLSV